MTITIVGYKNTRERNPQDNTYAYMTALRGREREGRREHLQ